MTGEENHLDELGGKEAWWLEGDGSVCGVTSGVVVLTLAYYDNEQALADGPLLDSESIVIGDAPEEEPYIMPPSRSEMHRNWLRVATVGATILTALGSVGVFNGKGAQKKASIAKTEQSVNTTIPTNIAPVTRHDILPPADPLANIAPSPNFLGDCQDSRYDDSPKCVRATLLAIDNARAREGMPPMGLPSNWFSSNPPEQLFVATNLERTARGLPPITDTAAPLNLAAAQGAEAATDPSLPIGFPFSQWASNWAGAVGNPLEAVYYWMYDDGRGSPNFECTPTDASGCWGHRNNVLINLSNQSSVMGTAVATTAYQGEPSLAEIIVSGPG